MLDQTTDRIMQVVGAIVVGSMILMLVTGGMPDIFGSVSDEFAVEATAQHSGPKVPYAMDTAYSYDDYVYNGHVVTGLSESGKALFNSGETQFWMPDKNPETGEVITAISDGAFKDYAFTGEFHAPLVETIGTRAFNSSVFTGDFESSRVNQIGDRAFYNAAFSGNFVATNVTSIADDAFRSSFFAGTFHAPNVETIGMSAFQLSPFTGNVDVPKLQTVSADAFKQAQFNGYFNGPELVSVASNAFSSSPFGEWFSAPKLTVERLADNAFSSASFTNDVDILK